jgi:site-specific DNA-methyltransferase (adenine-specific)
MGNVSLINGDALATMKTFPAASFDLIATDPPYFKVKDRVKAPWDHAWASPAEYIAWIGELCEQWQRILQPNGSLYVFASPDMAARVEVKIGEWFNVLNRIVWRKQDGTDNEGGLWNRANKESLRSFFSQAEYIIFAEQPRADNMAKGEAGYAAKCDELRGFIFEPLRAYLDGEREQAGINFEQVRQIVGCAPGSGLPSHWFTRFQWMLPTADNYAKLREGFARANHGGEYLRREYEDLRREYEDLRREYEDLRREYEDRRRPFFASKERPYTDVWNFATVPASYGKHICEKPADLMVHIVQTSTRPGAEVLDCFMGSGSTGEACLLLPDRHFTGIEADPLWYSRSEARLSQRPLLMIEEDAPTGAAQV